MNKDFAIIIIIVSVVLSFFVWNSFMDKYVNYSNSLPVYECNYTRGTAKVSDVFRPDDFNECEIIKHLPFLTSVYEHCSEQYNNLKQMYEEGKCSKIYSKKLKYDAGWCEISYTIKDGKVKERGGSSSDLNEYQRKTCSNELRKQIFK